ncbi:hypothetical protein UFOVP11_15 [uncultured Caudovirales phage]|uniref:Uncharacterized protein n=1 Tax=uncultured Caudovirales phage TaxID=2100421 RepID=A0A6J5KIS6_9CAUD|nr:hypothetical protein UFOVP11_15 [uncultured Caudovirales phage]
MLYGLEFLKGKIMFTIEYVKNLKWENEEHTVFSCVVKYKEFDEEHPTGVNIVDKYSHIQEIWINAKSGKYGNIDKYVAPLNLVIPPVDPEAIPTVVINE